MTAELLRDLIDIPERVHAGDFVLTLSKGVARGVHGPRLRGDPAAGPLLRRGARADPVGRARAGRRGPRTWTARSGPARATSWPCCTRSCAATRRHAARSGLVDVVAKHDRWLAGRKFLLVPYHMIEAASLESAILGGYVDHVRKLSSGRAAAGGLPGRRSARRRP